MLALAPNGDVFVAESLAQLSRTEVQRLIKASEVLVGGKPVKASYRLAAGDLVSLHVPQPEVKTIEAEAIPLEVIYEDGDLVAVNKPAGMVVHPAHGNESGTLVNAALARWPQMRRITGEERAGVVDVATDGRVGPALAVPVEPQVQLDELPDVVDHGVRVPEGPETLLGDPRAHDLVVVERHPLRPEPPRRRLAHVVQEGRQPEHEVRLAPHHHRQRVPEHVLVALDGVLLHPQRGELGEELVGQPGLHEQRQARRRVLTQEQLVELLLRRALEYAAMFKRPVISHCEDAHLTKGASMNEGRVATELGLRGWPAVAEASMAARDCLLARWTGARVHIAHVSAKETVEVIRAAKKAGDPVTAEAAPHHLTLDEERLRTYDARFRMNPPLRSAADVEAVVAGLADGTIDCIASDHAPHTVEEKDREFDACPNGVVGLETTLGVVLTDLVAAKKLTLNRAIEAMTSGPAGVLGLKHGTLAAGAAADVTVIDPDRSWKVDPARFRSRGRCTPWEGRTLKGAAVCTVVGGRVAFEA